MTTSGITQNAQDKILEKYRAQAIQFIDGDKLTDLVDTHANYFWHEISSSIGSYLQDLSKRLEQLDNDLNVVKGVGCDNFYIDPDIQEYELTMYSKNRRRKQQRLVQIISEVTKEKVCVLEADMGFGKSKTARHVALHYCAPDRFNHVPILPIFSTFRALVEERHSLQTLLKAETNNYFTPENEVKYKCLFIVDGVDEAIGKCEDWEVYVQNIIKETKATDGYHLLLTSRSLRRLDESVSVYAGSKRYLLRALSIQKLITFVEMACKNFSISKKVFEELQRSDLFKQLHKALLPPRSYRD